MKITDITRIIAEIQELEHELKAVRVEGESGGGLVRAVVSGKQELLKLEIDQSLINEKDKELIEDLVVGAVNNGIKKSFEVVMEKLKNKAMKLDILGGDSRGIDYGRDT